MKILILNGPNLNLLGRRDKEHYGELSLEKFEKIITEKFPQHEFTFYQSNVEGELINKIQPSAKNFDALIINPGGYSHSSVAIRDALSETALPKIEVHLSNLAKREDFRQNLITATGCDGYISGFKEKSYLAAVYLIETILSKK
ncbi:MAG: 3-dehydroquinate dehydratase [Bacteroidetes bacterium]|nr:3-dehydroquinate dehydratase [Bacteroidota bacterium]